MLLGGLRWVGALGGLGREWIVGGVARGAGWLTVVEWMLVLECEDEADGLLVRYGRSVEMV